MKQFKNSLFVFTRDLRIDDNVGLAAACNQSENVICCFTLDPRIVNKNKHFSDFRLKFLVECIESLREEFKRRNSKLHVFYDSHSIVVEKILKTVPIDAIFINKDHTKLSKQRSYKLSSLCNNKKIKFQEYSDFLLYDPTMLLTQEGKPYVVFSQFFKAAMQMPVSKPQKNNYRKFLSKTIESNFDAVYKNMLSKDFQIRVSGGRKDALIKISKLDQFQNYHNARNYPGESDTTMLSAHIRFGTCSIREIYYEIICKLGKNHTLMTQIHWREFFTHVLYHFPHVVNQPFRKKYANIQWNENKDLFEAWKNGKTGFPIIDAGMRELNSTGFMHNRVRMIAASFLTKDLHINWKLGERYFAEKLFDYDPAVNNGNWQWAASTGCDSQPWFRIFNPWLQQKKFDPDCTYIKKWIPEIRSAASEEIHDSYKNNFTQYDYPKPIVDHAQESKLARIIFKNCI